MTMKDPDCRYCDGSPDGPMLLGVGHAACVIRRLRELLDPDWEPGCGYEPLDLLSLWPSIRSS